MGKTYDFDIGILGGGAAGLTVAAGAAQLGAKVLLVEKENVLGGDCLHFGCVPSKTLIRTAQVYHEMKHAEDYGLPKVIVPPVDYRQIVKRIQSVIDRIQKHDSVERFCKLGAKVRFGEARFADEHSVRLNGDTISAKTWVVATGSSAAVPPIEGLDQTPYLTNRDLFSLDHLPRSLIVLGAGAIGLEMAQAFGRLGSRVTVVELSDQVLINEDKDMADGVMGVLAAEGVAFHLGVRAVGFKDLGADRQVMIQAHGAEPTDLRAEAILVAAGRKANVSGLGLEEIDVEFDRKGIKVDEKMRTTAHKHIFAAGDVTGAYLFTHAAGYEGGIVLSNAIFHLPRKANYRYFPWSTFTSPELASIGMNEKRAQEAGIEYTVHTEEFKDNDRSLAEGEETGRIKMILDEKERPLGVQILGPHAGDLISEWVAALNGKVKLATLTAAVHPYPTLGEINKRVVGNFFSGKIFSDKVKRTLRFLFSFKGRACELPAGEPDEPSS
jgi:pyruvate/2-oxoglutarate dehydrogenase complex dihydrolipoamide dehydrogenase (E3) component